MWLALFPRLQGILVSSNLSPGDAVRLDMERLYQGIFPDIGVVFDEC